MQTDGAEISIADIEKELSRLWETQKQKKLLRASLFNLVIYASDPRRVKKLSHTINTILEKYPCRIIFIKADNDTSKNYIKVNVASAMMGKGETAVACDEIEIEVSHSQLHRVPFIILPHFLPDLPIYLLWGQDPTTEYVILPSLHPYASRLIFDSDCTSNLQSFSRKMLQEIDTGLLEIRDINWASTGSWREVMAHLFRKAETFEKLRSCRRLKIEYNATKFQGISHPEIQGIYLQGWIAAQLEWTFHKIQILDDKRQIQYKGEESGVEVDLIPIETQKEFSDTLLSIEIITSEGNSYVIQRQGSQPKVQIHITTQDRCEIPYALPLQDIRKGNYFMQELFYRRTSDHYRNMLTLISHYQYEWMNIE